MKKLLKGSTAVTGIVLALSACSGDTVDTPSRTTPPSATVNDINPVSREMLEDGGTFTWPISGMPSNFNYWEIDGSNYDGHLVIAAMMPTPFTSTGDGTPVWNPNVLASEPVLTTDPEQVVTYRIHPEAAWYDGIPITWEDFHWQWQASSGRNPDYRVSSSTGYENIASIERGADDKEVVVTFETPFADWQSIFNPFYPASTNRDPNIFNEGWRRDILTSAGPFRLDSIDRVTQTITLIRNERWWGPPAKMERIIFRTISFDAQIDALANGEIDGMDIGADANTYSRATRIPGIEIRSAGGPNFRHFTLNGSSPTLEDVRVRRAVAMGINRPVIVEALLGPLGIEPEPLNNHIFMRNQYGYRDNSGEVGQYNPARAAELLDEAGWTLNEEVREKDGIPLEISFVIPSGIPGARQEGELVQNMLGQIGVAVAINTVPTNDFFSQYVTPGEFGITPFSWMGTPFPVSSVGSVYAMPTEGPEGEEIIQQNYARIGSPQIDQLLNEASREFDRDRAIELANQADALIWDEVHSLTTYQRPELIAVRPELANFGAFGFAEPWIYEDIGWMIE